MATTPTLGYQGTRLDLLIVAGATFGPHRVMVPNPDGTPADLTGCTLRASVRRQATDAEPLFSFTCTVDQPVITDPETETQGAFTAAPTDTAALTAACGGIVALAEAVWGMDVHTAEDAAVMPAFYGRVTVHPGGW